MTDKKILIINDVTAYGKVSSLAMIPVISAFGHHPYVLPTALVSNTMDYGKSVIIDTSQFIKDCINIWEEYSFSFPIVATGLINDEKQIDIIEKFLRKQAPQFVMVDPIMADSGKLYPGMNPKAIDYYKHLTALSDLIVPNYTEALLLSGKFMDREELSDEEYCELINTLLSLGTKNIVITGCKQAHRSFNLVFDAATEAIEKIYYEHIPVNLIGTGDIFSATLISAIMNGQSLSSAVTSAGKLVSRVVEYNQDKSDHFDIIIEPTIQEVINEIRQR